MWETCTLLCPCNVTQNKIWECIETISNNNLNCYFINVHTLIFNLKYSQMWYLYKYTENCESVVKYFSVAFIRTYIHLQPQQKSSQGDEERRRKYPESMSSTNRLVAKTKRLIVTHMWGLTLRKEKRTSTMWLDRVIESLERMYWRGGTSWGAGGKKKESEEDGWRTARATLAAGLDDMSVEVCGCLEEISVNLLTQVFSLGKWEDT